MVDSLATSPYFEAILEHQTSFISKAEDTQTFQEFEELNVSKQGTGINCLIYVCNPYHGWENKDSGQRSPLAQVLTVNKSLLM